MRALFPIGALVALLAMAMLMQPAPLSSPGRGACHGIGPAPQPLPPSLLAAFVRAFHLPTPQAARGAMVRCAGGTLLGCGIGANLPCGLADTRRRIPAAEAWCADHADARFIPAYVTGHATLYAWRCKSERAVAFRQVAHADASGYVAEYWRPLDP